MKVEITLKDVDEKECLILTNCHKEDYIYLMASDAIDEPTYSNPVMIKIEDLKIALKKITAK